VSLNPEKSSTAQALTSPPCRADGDATVDIEHNSPHCATIRRCLMTIRSLILVTIFALMTSLSLTSCGATRNVSYTYVKTNMSQQLLLDDEHRLKNTSGVHQVIPKIDDKKTARIEIIVDENNKAPSLRLLQDLGYHEVSN
jgi:hypothetical protein